MSGVASPVTPLVSPRHVGEVAPLDVEESQELVVATDRVIFKLQLVHVIRVIRLPPLQVASVAHKAGQGKELLKLRLMLLGRVAAGVHDKPATREDLLPEGALLGRCV